MYCLLLALLIGQILGQLHDYPEADILEELFYSYNKDVRPVHTTGDILLIEHGMALKRIISLNNNLLVADAMLLLKWTDHRLSWYPSDYSSFTKLSLDSRRIWKPDVYLFNNAGGTDGLVYEGLPAVITHNGEIFYHPLTRLTVPCESSNDVSHCLFQFSSWSYSVNQLNLTTFNDGAIVNSFEPHPDFTILGASVEWNERQYTGLPESYADVTYNVTMLSNNIDPVTQTIHQNTDNSTSNTNSTLGTDGNESNNTDHSLSSSGNL